jgi:branched-chain amino acid transport system ATP-binding protein
MTIPLLEITGLTRTFGGLRAVDDVSFTVEKGQVAAVIGPNGAGKTTLFNLVTGFLQPDAGTVRLDGRDIVGKAPHRIASLGLVRTFQLVRLFPELTAIENVAAGFHLHSRGGLFDAIVRPPAIRAQERQIAERAAELLDFVGLAGCADIVARHLTYGQQRLLEVARGLAAGPKIFLLDEPAAGLNPAEVAKLALLIRAIRDHGITVLFIEHDMSIVMGTAESVVVLDFGRRIAAGAPEAVQRDPAVLDAYLGGVSAGAGHV